MACEQFLEQVEAAALEYDRLGEEIQQLQAQQAAQSGIMMGSYMLYMACLSGQQGNRTASPSTVTVLPSLSEVVAFAKKTLKKWRNKLKK